MSCFRNFSNVLFTKFTNNVIIIGSNRPQPRGFVLFFGTRVGPRSPEGAVLSGGHNNYRKDLKGNENYNTTLHYCKKDPG
jgi:hypothetical protein